MDSDDYQRLCLNLAQMFATREEMDDFIAENGEDAYEPEPMPEAVKEDTAGDDKCPEEEDPDEEDPDEEDPDEEGSVCPVCKVRDCDCTAEFGQSFNSEPKVLKHLYEKCWITRHPKTGKILPSSRYLPAANPERREIYDAIERILNPDKATDWESRTNDQRNVSIKRCAKQTLASRKCSRLR